MSTKETWYLKPDNHWLHISHKSGTSRKHILTKRDVFNLGIFAIVFRQKCVKFEKCNYRIQEIEQC